MFVLGNLKEEMVCIQGRGGVSYGCCLVFVLVRVSSFLRVMMSNDKVRGLTLRLKITCFDK